MGHHKIFINVTALKCFLFVIKVIRRSQFSSFTLPFLDKQIWYKIIFKADGQYQK